MIPPWVRGIIRHPLTDAADFHGRWCAGRGFLALEAGALEFDFGLHRYFEKFDAGLEGESLKIDAGSWERSEDFWMALTLREPDRLHVDYGEVHAIGGVWDGILERVAPDEVIASVDVVNESGGPIGEVRIESGEQRSQFGPIETGSHSRGFVRVQTGGSVVVIAMAGSRPCVATILATPATLTLGKALEWT